MASYAADIRIGVTGRGQLNQLESQLKRVNSAVNQLNKQLQLRARVQAVRLDTRQAMSAVRALEQRINRLGRTINVNLRTNEQRRQSQGSGGGVAVVSNPTAQAAAVGAVAAAYKRQNSELEALLSNSSRYTQLQEQAAAASDKFKTKSEELAQAQRRLTQNQNGFADAGKTLKQSLRDNTNAVNFRIKALERYQQELNDTTGALNSYIAAERRAAAQVSEAEYKRTGGRSFDERLAALRSRRTPVRAGRSILAGAGGAASLVPGLSPLVIGGGAGLAASGGALGGGILGAIAAGAVLAGGALANFGKESAITAAKVSKLQIALRNVVGSEFPEALKAIDRAVKDFNTPIDDATEQFTKLNAAARASGFNVKEVEEVYRGLSAANKALGGDSERLAGILLATTQVFSKGKVQAEELRGQIGERLAGAFAKFAKSAGLTTSQLDKALEKGEVSLEDFVRFAKSLLDEYEEDAKRIAEGPEEAGERLKQAIKGLQLVIGPELARLGASFQDFATTAINALASVFTYLGQLGTAIQDRVAGPTLKNAKTQLARDAAIVEGLQESLDKGLLKGEDIAKAQARINSLNQLNKGRRSVIEAAEGIAKPLPPKPDASTLNKDKDKKGRKPRDRVAELTAELALERQLLEIVNRQTVGSQFQRDLAAEQLKRSELAAELERDKKDVASSNLTTQSKVLANQVLDARYTRELAQLDKERAQFAYDRKRSMDDTVRDLETQLKLETAITEQDRIRIEGAARLAGINRDDYSQDEFDRLTGLTQQITDAQLNNANPLVKFAKELTAELANTDQMLVDIASTLQTNVAGAFTDVFTGLISGTQSAQQTLANFFKATGEAFIAMAMEIISKQLVMIALQSVLKALGGATGGGGGDSSNFKPSNIGDNYGSLMNFAEGGYPPATKPSIVGEKGPELFIPGQRGMVVPNDIFEATRQALAGGSGGSDKAFADNSNALAVADSYTRERIYERDRQTMVTGAGGSTTIQTQVINSVEYATVDQVQKASEQSAKRARAQVFADMRNKPATRSSLGMR